MKITQQFDEEVIAFGFIESFKTLYEAQKSTLQELSLNLASLEINEVLDFSKLDRLKTL